VANETFVWGFMDEMPAVLQDMGWGVSSTSTSDIVRDNAYQYKPVGAPSTYSLAFDLGQYVDAPVAGRPATAAGSVSTAVRLDTGRAPDTGYTIIGIYGAGAAFPASVVRSNSDGTVSLHVAGVFKSQSTAVIDWQDFRWVTIFYDVSTGTHKARIEIDGVEVITEETEAGAVGSAALAMARISGFSNFDRATNHGAFVWRNGYTSAAPKRYVTIVEVDSDVSETGTWAPDTGSDNYARIDGTYDAATYTEEASPSANDKVVCGLTANLATKLGFTPTAIDAVCAIAVSTGSGQTARAAVGDGSAVTNGTTTAIGASATMTVAVAETKPSGGAWGSSDTPDASYEVVTV